VLPSTAADAGNCPLSVEEAVAGRFRATLVVPHELAAEAARALPGTSEIATAASSAASTLTAARVMPGTVRLLLAREAFIRSPVTNYCTAECDRSSYYKT
jgi:hypothetical protein